MKAAIDLISRKLASSEYSHQSSWAHLRANQLRNLGIDVTVLDEDIPRHSQDLWLKYDTIFIYHGMDYQPESKSLNVFDGLVEHAAKFFERIGIQSHDHLTYLSLDHQMPDYGQLCKNRLGTASDYWKNVDWDRVSSRCKNVISVQEPALHFAPGSVKRLVIGDSHSHSVYRPHSMVLRKDGRTLNGILKKGIKTEIIQYGYNFDDLEELTCYWGNIDVRHHLCRNEDPKSSLKDLLRRYEEELKTLNKKIELVTPLPIEDESRKIPKSGFFKGTPFYGSKEQRQDLVKVFKDELQEISIRNSWDLFSWPEEWYDLDGVEFMQTYMERPRSVHLARKYYRWDLVNNVKNPLLDVKVPNIKKLFEF